MAQLITTAIVARWSVVDMDQRWLAASEHLHWAVTHELEGRWGGLEGGSGEGGCSVGYYLV